MRTRKGYLIRRGKTYHAVWQVAGRKFMKSTHQTDRKDAAKELARIMQPFLVEDDVRTLETVKARIEGAKADLVKFDEQCNPPLTMDKAWDAYLAAPGRPDSGPSTLRQYEAEFKRFAKWLGEAHPQLKPMREVTASIAGAYAQHLTAVGATPSTFNQHIGFLRLLWRVLAKPARIESLNPWADIKRKRLIAQGRRELTVDELRRVCRSATGELRLLLALGLYTGLRLGDCATLRWGETDVVRGTIRRVPMKTARRSGIPVVIPIHPALLAMLSETSEKERGEYVLPVTAARYLKARSALKDEVQGHFESQKVKTVRETQGRRQRALVEVGFHSLRHSFVSLCREAGAPLSVVESIVGHSNPAMTRHYTHTSEAAAGAAVALLPDITGQADAPAIPAPAKRPIDRIALKGFVDGLAARNLTATKAKLQMLLAAG